MTQGPHTDDHPEHPHSAGEAVEQFADAAKHAVDAVNQRAGRDLFAATGVAIVLLGAAGASLLWFPWGFAVIAAAAAVGSQIELGRAIGQHQGAKVVAVPLAIGSAAFILGAYAVHLYRFMAPGVFLSGIIGLTVVTVLIVRLRGPIQGYLPDAGSTLFLLAYPGLLISALMFMLAESQGPAKIATFVVGVAACDTGGHLLGVLIGKHKFAPRISPKKSWEGVLGSFLLSGILVILMTVLLLHAAWWKGLALAVVIVVFSILGDLVESVIKRDLGIKDMGNLLPGHGGIMDRFDSYILAAMPAWLMMAWLIPHV